MDFNLSEEESKRVLRISSGSTTSENDWDLLSEALFETYQKIKSTNCSDTSNYSSVIQID